MAEEKKKLWEKPELIVISRSNPEEYVLFACFQSPAGSMCGDENQNRVAGNS